MAQITENDERLVDAVIEELKRDIADGDTTAIYELLLWHTSREAMINYLPEERWGEFSK